MSLRLTLLRHAHAGDAPPGGEDADRPLNPQGREAARHLGATLGDALPAPDRLRVSPSVRTLETARLVCGAAFPAVPAVAATSLYLASARALLAEIAATPDTCHHLMIVGHNPGLSELWSMVGEDAGFGGLAPCEWRSRELDATRWSDVAR